MASAEKPGEQETGQEKRLSVRAKPDLIVLGLNTNAVQLLPDHPTSR